MHTLQAEIIDHLDVHPTIDPAAEITRRVDFLSEYLMTTGMAGLVLGISGGQDSTLAGALAQRAVEQCRDRGHNAEFYAVRLPYDRQSDEADVDVAMRFIHPDHELRINIKPATDMVEDAVAQALDQTSMSDFHRGNVKARERMVMQYAIAGERNLLVVGTDHAAENVTGFFTKFGDGAADLLPLWGLNKRQGAALLAELGAPESTWTKVPTADLEDDRPLLADEDALGVRYSDIDDYLEGKALSDSARERIETLWQRGRHKRVLPATYVDTWWRS
ncbi:NH(3)-dependent NAD(+) synthetase [Corynebacterium ciconiae DSM 44920]|uniref:ammonia-dependent NAD(+) synthetase n=1 Tax=Corynebacterium ciconiae TaxID=227319 RepID=UPI00037577EC|nr:ammonia-dependent NAD(+) synthetase [Corynebacterium ciconiae]WKD61901.1 NH(3)-dependent NAD(+) synthetase [Corynebacterium ciconiae DSM 44920]